MDIHRGSGLLGGSGYGGGGFIGSGYIGSGSHLHHHQTHINPWDSTIFRYANYDRPQNYWYTNQPHYPSDLIPNGSLIAQSPNAFLRSNWPNYFVNNDPELEDGVAIIDTVRSSDYELHLTNNYEENLELEESMGRVGSRLSEDKVMEHLITRNYNAATTSANKESDICVICQEEYEEGAKIGGLNCIHQYHVECIKNWLLQKNSCPICKATAIS